MNTLISIRANIIYTKEIVDKKEVYNKHQEMVFLVDKPKYRYSNEGNVIRERGVEELRFIVSEESFDSMIDVLAKIKDVEPEELS
jgi:hypothetical protein